MTFELMSNGTLAKLPQSSLPEGVSVPGGPFVMLLLPHNRYLLGYASKENGGMSEHWVWGRPGDKPRDIFIYDGEQVSLPSREGAAPVMLSGETAAFLKKELLSQMTPPGDHISTALILRGFMKNHAAFSEGFPFQDETAFMRCLESDGVLCGAYWALRFALDRGEFDMVARLKAWLRAGPERFSRFNAPEGGMKIWFSILEMPGDEALQELEALSFSRDDIQHMAAQRISPLLLFNPRSGYLVLSRFGREGGADFFVWAFLPPGLWGELRERVKLPVHELLLALWGQHDVERALEERARYLASR